MMYPPTDTPPPEVIYTIPPEYQPHTHYAEKSSYVPPECHQPQYVVEKGCCLPLERIIYVTAALCVIACFGTATLLLLTNWRSVSSALNNADETTAKVNAKMTQVLDMVSNVNDLTKGFKAINSTALAQNIESGSRYSAEMLKSMNSKRSVSVTLQLPFGGDEEAEDPPGDDDGGGENGAPPRKGRPKPRAPLPAEP